MSAFLFIIEHWHGATATTGMTHIAIQENLNGKVVDWMEKVTDDQADIISVDMSQRIQKEMTYPGQIKITVIREKRSVNYAK